jgi:hypothetical protein
MKTSFLITGGIALALAIVLSYLLVTIVTAGFRQKHFPKNPPNLAQGIVLAGKLLAGMVLITGLFGPVRDFLLVSSVGNQITSGASLSFLLICCCVVGIAFVIASAFEGFLSRQVFKGQSITVELQENNLTIGIVRAVLISAIAFTLLFSVSMIMQSFIPIPAIPNIR